jgi:hypothetical protein
MSTKTPEMEPRLDMPPSFEAIDAQWIGAVLSRNGLIALGAPIEITDREPVGEGIAFTSRLQRLHLAGETAVRSVIIKLPASGTDAALGNALHAGEREVGFYQQVATSAPVRCPAALYADYDRTSKDFVLVLEDLAPLRPLDQLDGMTFSEARAMMGPLAAFHAWSWESTRLDELSRVIPSIAAPGSLKASVRISERGWEKCNEVCDVPPVLRELAPRYTQLLPFLIDNLSTPRTITHGDLRADNIFMDDKGPILIDFQVCTQEAGAHELAYLLSQSMRQSERHGHDRELVAMYSSALADAGVTYPPDRLWMQYRLGLVYSFISPLAAFLSWDRQNERGRQLLRVLLDRMAAAIEDCDALAVLPK